MLRIETKRRRNDYTLSLWGSLAGQWVTLLDDHWRRLLKANGAAKVTIVLSDVSFIDNAGEQLLEQMLRGGVRFVLTGCMNRFVVDRVRQRSGTG
ncbi:MAG: anti-sigma factor antagonist [Gemmatimonadales bacterium]|nr:anti-sigma factor antagonist [Gemmatimonadales bacterium]